MTECALQKIYTYFSQFIWEKYVFILTSPNFFGRCQEKVGRSHMNLGEVLFFSMTESALNFILTYFSQLYWEKHVFVLTSPNIFGRCQEKVGRSHINLGDVLFFPMTESALNFIFTYFSQLYWEKYVFVLTSPNIFGRCHEKVGRSTYQVYMLLPNFLDISQLF